MADKATFLIFAQETEGLDDVIKDIRESTGAQIDVAVTTAAVSERLMAGGVDCLVFNVNTFNSESLNLLGTWRLINHGLACLSVSTLVAKEVFGYTRKVKQIVLFERPYSRDDFRKICDKVVSGEMIYLRQHERFATEQKIHIERVLTNEGFDGVMRNMSRGGAYLETRAELHDHDVLKVTINLEKVAKSHVMYGEVVRVVPDAFGRGQHGIGIRYISPEDLYNALLDSSKK